MSLFKLLNISNLYLYYKKRKLENRYKNQNVIIGLRSNVTNSILGKDVFISFDSHIFNSNIGDHSYVNDNTQIVNATIGKFCSIASKVQINLGNHPTNLISTHPAFYSTRQKFKCFADKDYCDEISDIKIGNDVWIGHGAIVMGGITIGDGAIVAAGAVVTKDIPPYAIVGGIPAKVIKYRFNNDQIETLINSQWWNKSDKWLKENIHLFNNPTSFFEEAKQ